MQDPSGAQTLRPAAAGCGRILGDRRLRPHPNQPLKCPRCDSVNTKFCYYNNYNLSQPRHFCKSCRRYWTKGGVLRSVPVGGGCRKAKRSKTNSSPENRLKKDSGKTSPRSSSESSSLTATELSSASASDIVHTIPAGSPLAVPPPPPLPPAVSVMDQIFTFPPEPRLFSNPNSTPSMLEPSGVVSSGSIFPDSGSFTSLIAGNIASSLQGSGFGCNFPDFPFKVHHQKMDEMARGWNEPTAGLTEMLPSINDLTSIHGSAGNTGLTPLEWQTNSDPPPTLFDLPNAVDPVYWDQDHWEDHGHPLYLP